MGRSKANENLHKLSPILYDTLVDLELMPYRELGPPEALKAAWQGGDQVLIDATERAYRRSQEDAKQREHYRLVQVCRNRKVDFEDDAIGICAGLWNFALSY
jgi:hypothetical protein